MKKFLVWALTAASIVLIGGMSGCSDKDSMSDPAENKRKGEAFLRDNAKKEGVTVTASGLQYEVITAGPEDGAKPKKTSTVQVRYKGTFINGKQFDASTVPVSFGVGQLIKGWQEGLQLMTVGSKWRMFVPYQLAYGERGTGGIPPYSALIFEVELMAVRD